MKKLLSLLLLLMLSAGIARADQYDFGTIDPDTTSGSELADLLGDWRDALNTVHSGTSRPAYADTGTLWLDTTSSTWSWKVYDGAQDITLGTVNTTSNVFTPYYNGNAVGSMAGQAASAVAITGGSITGITDLAIADGGTAASTAAAGFDNLKQAATDTYAGTVELATTGEATAGSDTTRAVTPAGVAAAIAATGGGGDWTLVTSQTASASSALSFTGMSSSCAAYKFIIANIRVATSGAEFYFRTSTNNGSSYDSSASHYEYAYQIWEFDYSPTNTTSAGSASAIIINPGADNAVTSTISGELIIINPSNATAYKAIYGEVIFYPSSSSISKSEFSGDRASTGDIDAGQFRASTGNLTSGSIYQYCLSAS